ncbi:hypothetical protein AJ85_08385 [Alkalihalobacillus alcalophilus ATCC 27647 = CGMCC 1.3604]|uniref:Uncharacterized protein n=1 Tax=Alkalihalobacillus alcalophilus ATCC 27647 = CGMCC 1.3604 TaxID=1218173 RepID=A0A094YUM3_ALKAL|nr:hypothetical protein [Alkalihalobacillus alcalophilus]KGA97197.1 hypothetical protein BALCAV_0211825 [Alkalihalobacillus alcalophilus ATCC 27647 = CGMCC 1.3604]MED1560871.1 hypothetical protein [Alkalihalobacillus alcalophilus]THG90871.1 hypothetical protein AJ85_08385 [Alkalihalobacillus alcalophilus ATCC 27647 = CGMCC 1.3604]
MKRYSNRVAKFLFVVGVLIAFLGVLMSGLYFYFEIKSANEYHYYNNEWEMWRMAFSSFTYSLNSIGFTGFFLIAAAELIQVLHNQNNTPVLTYTDHPPAEKTEGVEALAEKEEPIHQLKAAEQFKVHHFFDQLGLKVDDIIVPPYEGYCIVLINDDAQLIEIGEFQPKILKFHDYPEIMEWYKNREE